MTCMTSSGKTYPVPDRFMFDPAPDRDPPGIQFASVVVLTVLSWGLLLGSLSLLGPIALVPWLAPLGLMLRELVLAPVLPAIG